MWIYTKKGFISAVQDRDDHGTILVRARFRGHLEALFPGAEVEYTPGADYRYRTRIPRGEFGWALEMLVAEIDYLNFKKSLDASDELYRWTCNQIWKLMARVQATEPFIKTWKRRE